MNNMKYDVAVVGAGPAGSTAAKFLSEKGYKVVIIEKNKLPRDKSCGGGLTKRVVDEFDYIDNERFIESYSYGGIAHSPSLKKKIEVHEKKPLIATVLREKFDFELLKLAKEKGSDCIDNNALVDVKILENNVQLILKDGSKIESKILIGADGVWSIIAKKTGLRPSSIDYAVCVQIEPKLDEKTINKYFGKSRIFHIHTSVQGIQGYGWIFPKKEHVNIGIGEFIFKNDKRTGRKLILNFKKYVDALKSENIIPKSIKIEKCKGGALPICTLKKTYSNRVILVGDAAGFVCPSSGEGIYYAMLSGKIAANIIDESLEKDDVSEKFLSKYQKIWENSFGKDLKIFYKTRKRNKKGISEKIYQIANFDKKLAKMIIYIGIGSFSVHKHKWKLVKRYIYSLIKYTFASNK